MLITPPISNLISNGIPLALKTLIGNVAKLIKNMTSVPNAMLGIKPNAVANIPAVNVTAINFVVKLEETEADSVSLFISMKFESKIVAGVSTPSIMKITLSIIININILLATPIISTPKILMINL